MSRLGATGFQELLFGEDDPHAVVERVAGQVRAEFRRQRDLLRRLMR